MKKYRHKDEIILYKRRNLVPLAAVMLLSRTSTGFSLSRKVPGLLELLLEVPLGALLEDMARVHQYTWSCNDVRMPILNSRKEMNYASSACPVDATGMELYED